LREQKSSAPLNSVFICAKCARTSGIALTLQYLLVTFSQRKNFSAN
jgi:hypothetical protein